MSARLVPEHRREDGYGRLRLAAEPAESERRGIPVSRVFIPQQGHQGRDRLPGFGTDLSQGHGGADADGGIAVVQAACQGSDGPGGGGPELGQRDGRGHTDLTFAVAQGRGQGIDLARTYGLDLTECESRGLANTWIRVA